LWSQIYRTSVYRLVSSSMPDFAVAFRVGSHVSPMT
jgi:hypothetical protein